VNLQTKDLPCSLIEQYFRLGRKLFTVIVYLLNKYSENLYFIYVANTLVDVYCLDGIQPLFKYKFV
jgi:hypothetical protein